MHAVILMLLTIVMTSCATAPEALTVASCHHHVTRHPTHVTASGGCVIR